MKLLLALLAAIILGASSALSAPTTQDVVLTWIPRPSIELVNCYHIWQGFVVPFHAPVFVMLPGDFKQPPARLTNVPAGQQIYFVSAAFKVQSRYPLESPRSKGTVAVAQ